MLMLIRLSPDHDVDRATALRCAGGIADMLNTDPGLPRDMRRPPHLPPETAEGVLAFTRIWCLERDAQYFALTDGDLVQGAVTLSRIDPVTRTARIGIVLASSHRDASTELAALELAVTYLRGLGIAEVSTGGLSAHQDDPLAPWQALALDCEARGGRVYARL